MNKSQASGVGRGTSLLSPALLAWFVAMAGLTMAVTPLFRGHGQWLPATLIGTTPTTVLFACAALFAAHWYVSGRLRAPIRKLLTVAVIVLPLVALMGAISGPSSIGSRFGGTYGLLFATLTATLPAWISVTIYGVVTFFGLLLAARMLLMPPPIRGDVFEALTQNAKRAGESRLGVALDHSTSVTGSARPVAAAVEDDSPLFGGIHDTEDSGRSTSASVSYLPEVDEAPPAAADPSTFIIAAPPRVDQSEIEVDDDSDLRVDEPLEEASHGAVELASFQESPVAEAQALVMTDDSSGPILAEADVMSESAAIADEAPSSVFEEVIDEVVEEVIHESSTVPPAMPAVAVASEVVTPLAVTPMVHAEATFDEHAELEAAVSEADYHAPIAEVPVTTSAVIESTPVIESLFGEDATPSEPLKKARRRTERGDWASWEDTPVRRKRVADEASSPTQPTVADDLVIHAAAPTVIEDVAAPVEELTSSDDVISECVVAEPIIAPSEPHVDVPTEGESVMAAATEDASEDEMLVYDEDTEGDEDEPVIAAAPMVATTAEFGFDLDAEYLGRALELAEQAGYASIGLFQAEMKVPFTTAAVIIERLAADGFLGPLSPTGRRAVLTLGESGEASAEA